jgi:protein involved in polysaccharide export with SLBB domain
MLSSGGVMLHKAPLGRSLIVHLFLVGLLGLLGSLLFAQSDSTPPALPAARIIKILKADYSLLTRAKQEFVSRAQSQGQPVPSDLSDDAFFEVINRSPTVRAAITDEFVKSGVVGANDPDISNSGDTALDVAAPAGIGAPRVAAPSTTPTAGTPRASQSNTSRDRATSRYGRDENDGTGTSDTRSEERAPAPTDATGQPRLSRKLNPYEDIPALRDLYTQTLDPGAQLQRFGANIFKNKAPVADVDLPAGPDYVLGAGDSLDLTMWGSVSRRLTLVVDREGRVILPDVGTVVLAGQTLASARETVQRALSNEYQNLRTDLTLGRLRQVRVYVVGDVRSPGAYDLSSLSTPLNALYAAGGPTEQGSLRVVRQFREGKLVAETDTYDLLLRGGKAGPSRLEPGDTILVPPVGPQVTVTGAVRRPAIYELKQEANLQSVLELAGGVLVSGTLSEIRVERVKAHQGRLTVSLHLPESSTDVAKLLAEFTVQDGDRVVIAGIPAYSDQTVFLEGHVLVPGKYSYREGMKLTDVVKSYKDLMPEPSDHAEIVRLDPPDFHPRVIDFNLTQALKEPGSVELRAFDTIRVFGRYEVDAPLVAIYGEVLRPGHYPLTNSMMATDLLRMAGGFKRSAYTATADLSSYNVENGERIDSDHRIVEIGKALQGVADTDVRLKPGDVLTIRQLAGWDDVGGAVTIKGEVMHPGRYGIQSGERLSDLLKRAGGFRETAYPRGALLTRQQVKELDAASREQLIRRIETSTTPPIRSTNPGEQAAAMAAFGAQQQQILKRLKEEAPLGRQVIKISADLKEWVGTSTDIELRPGDELIIPKRPGFVLVRGQVNSPAAITLIPGMNADWYLKRAGGATQFGNKKDAFIVRADGTVVGKEGSSSLWGSGVLGTVMHPGDTLVIPEKIFAESLFWKNLLNTAQVAANIAIAAHVVTTF